MISNWAGIPNVEHDWQDTAHMPAMERPRNFVELVLNWI